MKSVVSEPTASKIQQAAFYILHLSLLPLVGLLTMIGLMTAYAYHFPGIFFIPAFVVLAQTVPHLQILSHHKKSLLAITITVAPITIALTIVFIFFDQLSEVSSAAPLLLMLTFVSIVTPIISYRIFKRIIIELAPTPNPAVIEEERCESPIDQAEQPKRPQKSQEILWKIFVAILLAPILYALLSGVIEMLIENLR